MRDRALGLPGGDVDLEVHGLEADRVRRILERFGSVQEVGRSFGVFKLRLDGREIDVALPRGDGGRGEPGLGLYEACRRRDLTLNAMLYDVLDQRIIDLHGGLDDLRAGVLRECASDTFGDDPLRVLRAVRLAAVLGFELADSLRALCAAADLSGLPVERLRGELEKLLLRAPAPGYGLRLLLDLDQLDAVLPGLSSHSGAEHAAALDRAARHRDELSAPHRRYALMMAALLYPLGPGGAVRCMTRLNINRIRGRAIRQLVRSLIAALPAATEPLDDAGLCALADAAPPDLLLPLADAVHPGQLALLERAEALGVARGPLPRLVDGGALIRLGFPPGEAVGRALERLREAQHRGRITTREEALALARELLAEG